jgi:hypothetical protein
MFLVGRFVKCWRREGEDIHFALAEDGMLGVGTLGPGWQGPTNLGSPHFRERGSSSQSPPPQPESAEIAKMRQRKKRM